MPDISDWDNEPGFDPNSGEFIRLDLDEWLRKHDILKEARKQGAQNQPAESQNRLSATEAKVLAWINRRGVVCRQNASNHLADLERDLADMENDEGLANLRDESEQIRRNGEFDLELSSREVKGKLAVLWENVSECVEDFKEFRKRSGLTRLADYSGRTSGTLWFISVCFIVEVVLNASLLMEVNTFGLVGATLQMALISAVNILIAGFAMGGLLRRKNHVDLGRKCFAWAGIAGILIGVFGFNCAVGHLRDSMQAIVNDPSADIFAVGADVWLRLQENLVGFDSFQSLLLALMGILFFGVASWKWLQRDDAYPDYGRRDREVNSKRQEYSQAFEDAGKRLHEATQKHISKLEAIRHQLTCKQTRWKEICIQGKAIVDAYPIQLGAYQSDLEFLIQRYRTANLEAREEPAPGYFERQEKVNADILLPLSFKPPPQQTIRDVTEQVAAEIKTLQQLRRKLALEFPILAEFPAMEAA